MSDKPEVARPLTDGSDYHVWLNNNCDLYKLMFDQAWDGVLRHSTVEYEMQQNLDEAMLAAWTTGCEKKEVQP